MSIITDIKVADEVFLVVADLHQRNPQAEDFSTAEILRHARELNLTGKVRPGVAVHVSTHCVANLPPNPGQYRMLFAPARGRRRLLLAGDPTDPGRSGKIFPDRVDLDPTFWPLLDWALARFNRTAPTLGGLLGSGKHIWADESADRYVERLRGDWQ